MVRYRSFAMAALVACLACSFPLSASDDDLFGAAAKQQQPAAPVKVYESKPPVLLPPEQPARDLFSMTPSPSVEALKQHAEKRLAPDANRPLVVGMCCKGVIANYDEAYRIALKEGKPLRVLVGQPFANLVAQGSAEDGYIKCRVDEGAYPEFRQSGVYEYHPGPNGRLWSTPPGSSVIQGPGAQQAPPQTVNASATVPSNSTCNIPGCACGCANGAPCSCSQARTVPQPVPQPMFQPQFQPQFVPMWQPMVQFGGGCPGGNCSSCPGGNCRR